MIGANAARQQNYASQVYYARIQAQQQREAIARRNQQILQARQEQQNYWSRLGVSKHLNFWLVLNSLAQSIYSSV